MMFQNVGGKLVDMRVIPIPIREDCTVRVFDIPHDLTRAEAEKIGRVVIAMVAQGIEAGTGETRSGSIPKGRKPGGKAMRPDHPITGVKS